MKTTIQTTLTARALATLKFLAGEEGAAADPDGTPSEQAAAFDELLRLGFVRELPDAVDGEAPYLITPDGVRELAARAEEREAAKGMSKKERRLVCAEIEAGGFDRVFVHGSDFAAVGNPRFHELRRAYLAARKALAECVGWER